MAKHVFPAPEKLKKTAGGERFLRTRGWHARQAKVQAGRVPEARHSKAQGARDRNSGLWNPGFTDELETSPVCFALPGLDLTRSHPGLRPLRVLRPGLCCTALSALVTIPVSLTRMPCGALPFRLLYRGFAKNAAL